MQVVYLADNPMDAHLVKHALEAAGLPVFVLGESLLGGMGELPLFGVLRVCVPASVWAQAQDIVAALGLGETGTADAEHPEDGSTAADSPGLPLPA